MELFDPEIEDDFLFMDLDTVVVGPINDFLKPRPVTAFGGGGGCLMWLTEEGRREPWRLFNEDPEAESCESTAARMFSCARYG